MSATLTVPNGDVKMLRETLCLAQAALRLSFPGDERVTPDIDRLSDLIAQCGVHRPLGPDGKHGDRHTPTCGCDR